MFPQSFLSCPAVAGSNAAGHTATPASLEPRHGGGTACPAGEAMSFPGARRRTSRRKSLGQGMTEYIVIVALVGVAAIGVYSFLGQSIRGATSGIALEIAGESADKGIKAAKDAADKAVSAAESKATLKNYNANNH